jgi:NADPH-dependent 2,4-dienoyl-CoA reductase/sulfur reductase-like enzyme
MAGNTEVVVIGGGYAGVLAANRLTQRDDITVTLINARSTFVERIRLHQLVGGSYDAVVDYREILADGVRLVVDTVIRIDAAECTVALATGGRVGYGYLIYAVGSVCDGSRVPGAAEFAYPIAGPPSSSIWLRRRRGAQRAPPCQPGQAVPAPPAQLPHQAPRGPGTGASGRAAGPPWSIAQCSVVMADRYT